MLYISEYMQGQMVIVNEDIWKISSGRHSQQVFMNDPQRVGHEVFMGLENVLEIGFVINKYMCTDTPGLNHYI